MWAHAYALAGPGLPVMWVPALHAWSRPTRNCGSRPIARHSYSRQNYFCKQEKPAGQPHNIRIEPTGNPRHLAELRRALALARDSEIPDLPSTELACPPGRPATHPARARVAFGAVQAWPSPDGGPSVRTSVRRRTATVAARGAAVILACCLAVAISAAGFRLMSRAASPGHASTRGP